MCKRERERKKKESLTVSRLLKLARPTDYFK